MKESDMPESWLDKIREGQILVEECAIIAADLSEIQDLIMKYVRKSTGAPGTSHDIGQTPETDVLQSILQEIVELKKYLLSK